MVNALTWIVVITAIAGVGGTGLGGLIGACVRKDSNRIVSLFLSFAGGVMLAVVCFDLIIDALFPEGAAQAHNLWLVIASIVLGYGIVALLNDAIDRNTNREVGHYDKDHPQTADDLDELIHSDHYLEHKNERSGGGQLFVAGIIMAAAIALHNLPEGMVIGAAYAGGSGEFTMGGSALVLAVVIGLHNIPEGMAVAVPLVTGGMRRLRAVLVTALSGAPTIIGSLIGYALGEMGPVWQAVSLSFASGAMMYVVFGELLPESILMWRSKVPALAMMIGMLTGLVIIFA